MSENRPLLFINSAQSQKIRDKNQYVFDSRYSHPIDFSEKAEPEKPEKAEVTKEIAAEQPKIEPQEKPAPAPDVNDNEVKMSKLLNKLELLNKRARLGRFVLVKVEHAENTLEGYFMNLQNGVIVISNQDGDIEIPVKELKNVEILKV